MEAQYKILLYYKFSPLADLERLVEEQTAICQSLGLRGRIFIGHEGINGTVSGLDASTQAYMDFMNQHPTFSPIEFKDDPYHQHAFHKLFVRVRPEIVALNAPEPVEPWNRTAPYIEPDQMREVLRNTPSDVVILDTRSDYEFAVGRFKGAITLPINNFKEIIPALEQIEHLKDKTIITYCTGGIRCEKLTGFMMDQGFKNVYQLHGGIIRYGHETGGEDFEGSCYVFDERVVAPVNRVNPTVIGKCTVCGTPTEKMINCANADCNNHSLVCDSCCQDQAGCCSQQCMDSSRKRAWDGSGQYFRGVNSKSYV
jgi:UPF0176 protein